MTTRSRVPGTQVARSDIPGEVCHDGPSTSHRPPPFLATRMPEHTDDVRLQAMGRVAAALAGELDLDDLLTQVVEVARTATGARYAALGVLGDDYALARFVYTGIDDETARQIGHLPTGRGVLGVLIRDPRIVRVDDLAQHPASSGFPPNHPPMASFLGAPVASGGTVYGNLYLTGKPGGFTAEDERFIEVLAVQVGAAIDNAILADRLQDLAVAGERERLSRDLHDGIIQTLFSVGMGLDGARVLVHRDPDRVAARLDHAIDVIDTAIRDLRNTIFDLRPDDAAGLGLRSGLVELAREHEVNALTRPRLVLPDRVEVEVPVALVPDIMHVVREALANVARHAGASDVEVALDLTDDVVEVVVVDDGVGFDPDQPSAGHGLVNVRERAGLHGGSVTVDAAPGRGTRVQVRFPRLGGPPHDRFRTRPDAT